jgi:biopolymer transport protein ExbB
MRPGSQTLINLGLTPDSQQKTQGVSSLAEFARIVKNLEGISQERGRGDVVKVRIKILRQILLIAGLTAGSCLFAPLTTFADDAAAIPELNSPPANESQAEEGESASSGTGFFTILMQMIDALDEWVIPFAMATLIAVWFTAERLVVLRRGRVIPRPFVKRFLKLLEEGELDSHQALEICEDNGSPIAQVFAHGVRKWGKPSVEVEQAIIDGGERQVSSLRKHVRVLNGVATVSPLLGLLGTVWGMFMSFDRIAHQGAMGNTDQLAEGIALALVTTVVGLIIAIPALITYMYLNGRVDSLVADMDLLSQRIVNCVSAEAIADRANRPRSVASDAERASRKKRAV